MTSLFMPLYGGPTGAKPVIAYNLSAASGPPVPSDGDKTYTIPLKTEPQVVQRQADHRQ